MTKNLESALDSVSRGQWGGIAAAIAEMDPGSVTRKLLFGLYAEHLASESQERRVIAALEEDHRRWVEELSADAVWPERVEEPRTKTMFHDPDTGETRIEE